ncbi:MAG: hypothetical protein K0A98_09145 [Trueperaceae bacterium]|nr:hypothetical protein [Trueperaceae bacterium]
MRPIAFLPVFVVLAVGIGMIAANTGGSPAGLTASAQAQAPILTYDQLEIPFFDAWVRSPHADLTSLSFTYWNSTDPLAVPTTCAKCHSNQGFHDFIGLDGSQAGVVDEPAAPGILQCTTCHNDVTVAKAEVVMPSGELLTGLGREAVCMECHQGRQSGVSVAGAIERAGVDHDAVMDAQGFLNIHYYAAAATLYGADAGGGFEYPGKRYEPRFEHVSEFATCQTCHDPHSLQLDAASCATCHTGVETVADLKDIRMPGSFVDYDGDGDITTGIYYELSNLRSILFGLIQQYAADVVGRPIGYADGNPYYFFDLDGDGQISREEQTRANAYNTFTPRLLAAAYNYQVAKKDPGGYAHNAKYLIQIVYDSIEDLAGALGANTMALTRPGDEPAGEFLASAGGLDVASLRDALALTQVVDLGVIERLHRDDAGHFDAASQAWRYWDGAGAVPATCSTCHAGGGLPFFVANGVQIAHAPTQGMQCTTCHVAEDDFGLLEIASVRFPSGADLSFGTSGDNLCAVCHQGRASTGTVDARIGAIEDDVVSDRLGFINVHYFSAAASRFGGEAMGGYQYAGQDYVGFWPHDPDVGTCTQCHDPHNQQIDIVSTCSDCHAGVATVADLRDIREFPGDFDGDGDESVGTYYEIYAMVNMLNEAMQAYARDVVGTPIVYSSAAHPYFYIDANGNGVADPEEINRGNMYATWTPRLLRAAYNYQYAKKDTGGYAHNSQYIIQLLHDSIADLGWDVSGMHRPSDPF